MRKPSIEFYTSLITVILAISAIAIFIRSGGHLLFYITVIIAIAFGLYNIWRISRIAYKPVKGADSGKANRPGYRKRGF